ncbi:MAG: hypothetical protein J6K70_03140 [Selenomonadales bacterium]|nr:hypothetical protein [Selenomonadales bacterium]
MKQWISRWLVGVCLFASASIADANPHFISTDEVELGMTGYAKTVVEGAEIEMFDVKVIGFADKGAEEPLILIQVSGDVIERTGGVVQGMSGSPVYIDGRLLGAISYGYKFGDATKCMVTPIREMTAMWDMPDPLNNPLPRAIDLKKVREEKAKNAKNDTDRKGSDDDQKADDSEMTDAESVQASDEVLVTDGAQEEGVPAKQTTDDGKVKAEDATPLMTPVMVSGFSENAFEMLKEDLASLNMVPYASNGMEGRVTKRDVEAGSSVGAVLMRGDFKIGALGTATYVEGNKIVAFGHPFLQTGNSNYFLTNSEIFTTVTALESGFKVGATGAPIGLINQDRSAGLAGIVGKYPAVIPMEITVTDRQSGTEKTFCMQTIHNEKVAPAFLTAAFCSAIDKTIDRKGAGTATVDFAITARDLPGEVYECENMYYDESNIAVGASGEFSTMVDSLMNNRFRPIEVISIKANVDIDENCRSARMIEVTTDAKEAYPGETINFKVKIRPHRGDVIVEDVPYVVPSDATEGPLDLVVRGGGVINKRTTEALEKYKDSPLVKAIAKRERKMDFDEVMDKIRRQQRNNDIVIEEDITQVLEAIDEMEKQGIEVNLETETKAKGVDLLGVKKRALEEEAKSVQKCPTIYIIENQLETSIMVVRGKKTESDKGSAEKKTVSLKDDNRSANEKTSDKIKE